MNILLVDSSHLYRGILQDALAQFAGVHVYFAASCAEAKTLVGERSFGFFVLAGQLPDGDGVDLARWLRRGAHAKVEPIVLLTSSATGELAQQALLSGVTELFRKQDLEELLHFMQYYVRIQVPMNRRIMYVEDAKDQRALLEAQLRGWGMTVDAFQDADDAWLAFQKGNYDLLLCDVVLGGKMTGTRQINRIRRLPATLGGIPIIAVTASIRRRDGSSCCSQRR
jgi:CheY-like chemotaxis protein